MGKLSKSLKRRNRRQRRIEQRKGVGEYLDSMCRDVRGHPVLGVGDGLLDWRKVVEVDFR